MSKSMKTSNAACQLKLVKAFSENLKAAATGLKKPHPFPSRVVGHARTRTTVNEVPETGLSPRIPHQKR
jgi:hypothetical protein